MSRSSDRGQTDPLVALVAVAAVGLSLSAYGGLLGDALAPTTPSPAPTLDSVTDDIAPAGVADPEHLPTLSVGEATHVSPTPPEGGTRHARQRLPIRRANGTVDAGRIRVTVW